MVSQSAGDRIRLVHSQDMIGSVWGGCTEVKAFAQRAI